MADGSVNPSDATPRFSIPVLRNKQAIAWAREHAAETIQEINEPTRRAIRGIIVDTLDHGEGWLQAAKDIDRILGLTPRQAAAVDRRRADLATRRRSPERIERMAARYAKQMRRNRAQAITRDELKVANNEGDYLRWFEWQRQGILPLDKKVYWLAAKDLRTCATCKALDGQQVRLGEEFVTPSGARVKYPPAHRICRCAFGLVPIIPPGPLPAPPPTPNRGHCP